MDAALRSVEMQGIAVGLERELAAKDRELAEVRASLRAFCEGLEIEKIDLLLSVGTAGDFRALGIKMTERIKAIRQAQAAGRWKVSDTPRTDALHDRIAPQNGPVYCYDEMINHARGLERELAEAREVAKNLAILCYASGVGFGTKTMMEYEAMKQRNAPRGGGGGR